MGHFVYKYVYNNEIIYIGKNDTNLVDRLKQHGKHGDNIIENAWKYINNSNIFYIEVANSTMADVIESELIRRYKPKYNKAKTSDWEGLPFIEPNWKQCIININNKDKNGNKYSQRNKSKYLLKFNNRKQSYLTPCKIQFYDNRSKIYKKSFDSIKDANNFLKNMGYDIGENLLRQSMFGGIYDHISIDNMGYYAIHSKEHAFRFYKNIIKCSAVTPLNPNYGN